MSTLIAVVVSIPVSVAVTLVWLWVESKITGRPFGT